MYVTFNITLFNISVCLVFILLAAPDESIEEMGDGKGKLTMPVKKRLRFTDDDDIALLREVAGQNPFQDPGVWVVIKEHVFLLTAKDFSIKSLKDHLDLIIKLWLKKTKILKFKSGTEEDHTEKEQLCQNIHDLMVQFRNKPKNNISKNIEMKNGKKSRDEWAQNLYQSEGMETEIMEGEGPSGIDHDYCANEISCSRLNDSITVSKSGIELNRVIGVKEKNDLEPTRVSRPTRSRKRKLNVQRQGLSYLEQYDQRQLEIKKQDQILEKRKIDIEERKIASKEKKMDLAVQKFNLEYEKKTNLKLLADRLTNDIEQRKDMTKIIERQDKLIEMLLSNIQK